jgi:hypothetical protein
MAADPSVVINLAAEYTGKKAFDQAGTATGKLSKTVKNLAKTFGIAFSVTKVLAFAKASVMAAAKDQKAQVQLALALKNVGLERDAASAERFIQKLQSEYGVVDDLLRPAYQKLAVATKNTAETQRLLGIALDVSASTGKDLDSVTSALSKAYLGNNTALGKLGIGISKADLKTKSFQEITTKLGETFKGAAAAAANTFSGSLAKLGVASENVKEIIGGGIIDSLKLLSQDNSVDDLASSMERLATATANTTLGLAAFFDKFRVGGDGLNIFAAIARTIGDVFSQGPLGNFMRAGEKLSRISSYKTQKNPIQAGTYLATQKKITALTKEQQKAQAKILADKKSQAILDKANLALAKGNDIFNLEAISLNAAQIGQTQALGKATTEAQVLAIANDMARLTVKQDILALEAAIASKDEASIVAATNKLNADLKILGTLQTTAVKLGDIEGILKNLNPKDLVNLANLDAALEKIKAMLALLALINGGGSGNKNTPNKPNDPNDPLKNLPTRPLLTGQESTAAIIEVADASAALADAIAIEIEARNAAAAKAFNDSILAKIVADAVAAQLEANRERYGNQGMGTQVTIIDKTSGLIEVVQNAVQENNRFGNTLTYAGAL